VTALDLSAWMGRIARRRVARESSRGSGVARVNLLRASAFELPFVGSSFDNLVSTFPTEYIFESKSLGEAWRVMRPGSRWVIIPIAQLAPRGVWHRLSAKLFEVTGQAPDWDGPLAGCLRSSGFRVHQQILSLPQSHVHVTVATKPE